MSDAVNTKEDLEALMIGSAYQGALDNIKYCLKHGADIEAVQPLTGLSALHAAIGRNHIELVRFLLKEGARVKPDSSGRWPSTIAELCEADGEICDMIVDAENKLGVV